MYIHVDTCLVNSVQLARTCNDIPQNHSYMEWQQRCILMPHNDPMNCQSRYKKMYTDLDCLVMYKIQSE